MAEPSKDFPGLSYNIESSQIGIMNKIVHRLERRTTLLMNLGQVSCASYFVTIHTVRFSVQLIEIHRIFSRCRLDSLLLGYRERIRMGRTAIICFFCLYEMSEMLV